MNCSESPSYFFIKQRNALTLSEWSSQMTARTKKPRSFKTVMHLSISSASHSPRIDVIGIDLTTYGIDFCKDTSIKTTTLLYKSSFSS